MGMGLLIYRMGQHLMVASNSSVLWISKHRRGDTPCYTLIACHYQVLPHCSTFIPVILDPLSNAVTFGSFHLAGHHLRHICRPLH